MKWILSFFILSSVVIASTEHNHSDEFGQTPEILEVANSEFQPDEMRFKGLSDPNALVVRMFIERKGKLIPVKNFALRLGLVSGAKVYKIHHRNHMKVSCQGQQSVGAYTELTNNYYEIKNYRSKKLFELYTNLRCGGINDLVFYDKSPAGQVINIASLLNDAVAKFKEVGILKDWNREVTVLWPANGDFFNGYALNITNGHYWDVVGHELGHFIYHTGRIGQSQGGQHYIDRCYSETLAFSEGWASYFSAWLSIKLNDPDAKFEYMVKRRAPIRFENIPTDVCAGPTNEWRVSGFLWDLIDHNNDNESSRLTFEQIWKMSKGKRFRGVTAFAKGLKVAGMDPVLLNMVWENNFLESF